MSSFELISRSSMISTRSLLESTDRNRRAAEQDLSDTNEELAEATNVNQALTAAKRKLEAELNQMNVSPVFACVWVMIKIVLPGRPGRDVQRVEDV